MECKHCGSSNSLVANFCQMCGQPVSAPRLDIALKQAMMPPPAQPLPAQPFVEPPQAEQPVPKNYGGISEVTFFSTPQRAEMNRISYKTFAWEAAIILIGIMLSIAAYAWVEKSNVVKRLGQPAIVKQHVKAPLPAGRNGLVTAAISAAPVLPEINNAETVAAKPESENSPTEYIEPPSMGHPEPPSASAPTSATVATAKLSKALLSPPRPPSKKHPKTARNAIKTPLALTRDNPPANESAIANNEMPASAEASSTPDVDSGSVHRPAHQVIVAQSQSPQAYASANFFQDLGPEH